MKECLIEKAGRCLRQRRQSQSLVADTDTLFLGNPAVILGATSRKPLNDNEDYDTNDSCPTRPCVWQDGLDLRGGPERRQPSCGP